MMQSKDAKSVIAHMQAFMSKRLSSLKQLLKETAGQLEQYMVLWDYQDKGYTHYRIRANGDNCKECSELHGKIFPIYEAESGINFAPIHPNCDCSAEVLDKNANAVSPFLSLVTKSIHNIDIREMHGDERVESVFEYIKENRPDYVMVLYSGLNVSEDDFSKYDFK